MEKGKVIGPDDGNLYKRANDMFVKVTAADTGGAYEVCEERCPPGFASRRHMHPQNHETFYVIEGSATFILVFWIGAKFTPPLPSSRSRRTNPSVAFVILVSSLLSVNRGWSCHRHVAA